MPGRTHRLGGKEPGDAVSRALITGIGGQDGYYLTTLLIDKGYEVIGCGRPRTLSGERGDELRGMGVELIEVDLLDREQTQRAIRDVEPAEIYNLAGHSFVPASWDDPAAAVRITSWPVIHLLEAIRLWKPSVRFYQSSTSEIFGLATSWPQDETTPVAPANPYAAAKVFAHQIVQMYRGHYGLFVVAGIVYNHESPRRPRTFVTRKITSTACRIKAGLESRLTLGDLDVTRDWGYAGDYVEAMWRMLQAEPAEDFIIGTGIPHTVREVCEVAFARLDLDYREYVDVDPALTRPGQPTRLLANPAKAQRKLGWQARMSFETLIQTMVDADQRVLSMAPA